MENLVILKKEDLNDFVMQIARTKKVVAPVRKGVKSFAFEEVTSGARIDLDYTSTILPPKKYFLPQKETIIEYDKRKKEWTPTLYSEEIVLFGVHTCDLFGIQCLDIIFSENPKDFNYILRKNRILIIGLECSNYCDENASCALMDNQNPNGGYDLFFTEIDDRFIIHVNTYHGEKLINKTGLCTKADKRDVSELRLLKERKRNVFKNEVDIPYAELKPLFVNAMKSKVWDEIGEKCVSCGNCTNVCPTCYCFDIIDDINLDLNTGTRTRVWDSCQNGSFAEVAGGENFREDRGERQRHRLNRKFNYPVSKFRRYFCTGCGRCTRACVAGIDLKETINALIEEKKGNENG
ncbi:4Fe-4S dicluster domain-containing protein [bacterium]|nr:4Fe-4S dicluster domain-containing protein [bacterium]